MNCTNLLVITIERRTIAVAAFSGIRLDYTETRELSSDYDLARTTARRFVSWALEAFQPEHLLLELPDNREGTRREDLRSAIKLSLAAHPVGRTYLPLRSALGSFGVPELRTKSELTSVAGKIWPTAARTGKTPGLLAAALGLHYQLSELFLN